MDEESFKASSGWFHKFGSRYGGRAISLQGESLSADASAVDAFRSKLLPLMQQEGYTLTQIFIADEIGPCLVYNIKLWALKIVSNSNK